MPTTKPLFEMLQEESIEPEYVAAIPLNQITKPKDAIAPVDDLIEDVRRHGVIEPLVLQPMGATRYEIISGRRRYLAAIEADRPTVPALIVRVSKPQRAVLTMKLHKLRAENFIADVRAYEELLAKQLSEKEIGDLTGLSKQEIDRRKRLITGDKRIVDLVLEGKAKISVAESAAKLPPVQQKKLMDQIEESGENLTAAHVREIKTVQSSNAVAALPQTLFAQPTAKEVAPVGVDQFAVEMWVILSELDSTGCLKVERPKTTQLATNARIGANLLIERIRKATVPHADANPSTSDFTEDEGERLRQEALSRWRKEPVPAREDSEESEFEYAARGANPHGVYKNVKVGAEFNCKKSFVKITVAQDKKDGLWRTGYEVKTGQAGSSGSPSVKGAGAFSREEAIQAEMIHQRTRLQDQLKNHPSAAEATRIRGLIAAMEVKANA